jgi:hypothetical protein
MKRLFAALTVMSLTLTGTSAFAQQQIAAPHLHAVNPNMSLSMPATTPLQQQMRDDYATSLMGAQRELLQQNPSGLTPQERSIAHDLNSYTGPQ